MSFGLIEVGILAGALLLLIVAGYAIFVAMQSAKKSAPLDEDIKKYARDSKVEQYERPSSIVAEQIEEMVKKKLETFPDLADTVFDFGAVADGTIDIWVNKRQYDNVSDIPDERIRKAIQEAVASFNQQK